MKRYIRLSENTSIVESPSAYLIDNFPLYDKGMQTYNINGKAITTNFRAMNQPTWNGYSKARGYSDMPKTVDWGKQNEIFDELIAAGYTELKFVKVPTSIRGLSRTYVFYK